MHHVTVHRTLAIGLAAAAGLALSACGSSGGKSRANANQCGLIGCRYDDHRSLQTCGTEIVLDKFPNLAAPFANQRDDNCVDRRCPSQHRKKRRLADA